MEGPFRDHIEGRPNGSGIAGYTDVTKPCQIKDEINSSF